MDLQTRFKHADIIAEHYSDFKLFATDAIKFMGFDISPMQLDIADYIANGPKFRMIMAGRGEAKSTLAYIYCIWRLIQRPSTIIFVVTSKESLSMQVATGMKQLLLQWDILEYMRPDRNSGDRVSTAAFDIHYALKGVNKSPSMSIGSITGGITGNRADFLCSDDIEAEANSDTAGKRDSIKAATQEFTSICRDGDIMYIGTPQSKDSVYNTLPNRGVEIRIWPSRVPTFEEEERYMGRVAPYVQQMMLDPSNRTGYGLTGTQGKPTDPVMLTEQKLIETYVDQGPEKFQLQFMLDSTLSDEIRMQLKLSDLVVANFGCDVLPEVVQYQSSPANQVPLGSDFPVPLATMYYASNLQCAMVKPTEVVMCIDPAMSGQDALGFAVGTSVGPYIHILDAGGLMGGYNDKNEEELKQIMIRNKVTRIVVESNMGHGLFEINLRAVLQADDRVSHLAGCVEGKYATGQKEKRIIESLVSPMQRHRVIVHQQVFDSDRKYLKQHSSDKRTEYSLWYQLSSITTDRGSLNHDDVLEAVSMVVRELKFDLDIEEDAAAEARKQAAIREYLANPMGYKNTKKTRGKGTLSKLRMVN